MVHINLQHLRRDWITGITGEDLCSQVQECRARFDELSPEARLRGIQISEKAPIGFAAQFFAAILAGLPIVLVNPNWGEQERAQLKGILDSKNPPEASILIPTGGTTGGVKLAIHTWGSLSAACLSVQDFLGGGPIHSACRLPLFHVSGLMQLLRSFISGGCIHFDDTVREGDCLSLVPTQLQRALPDAAQVERLKTARVIFVGGAAIPEPLANRARELRLPVVPVYGMTETAAMVAAVPNDDFLRDPQAGAVPLGDARFAIEDDGRIRIQTPALFQGYQSREPVDLSQGYITGDRGRIDADGRLHVLGRIDRLINTGGEKVDPAEVEAALLQLKGVEAARVFGQPDPEWGQAVVAQVVTQEPFRYDALKAALVKSLSPHKIPKRIDRVEQLPGGRWK